MMKKTKIQKNTALRRIKYLLLIQLGDSVRKIKEQSKKKLIGHIALRVLFAGIVTAVMVALFWTLGNVFQLKTERDMLVTILFITQLISIISCVGGMSLTLFSSKENAALMAFPCKYSEVFLSKILLFSLEELKKSVYFLLPLLIGIGVNAQVGWAYWLQLPFYQLLLCLFPVFLGATLSVPAVLIKRFMQAHVWIYAALLISIIVSAFIGIYSVLSKIEVPINLVGGYGAFIGNIKATFAFINKFAFFYNFIGNAAFGELVYLYLPLTVLILISVGALCFLLALPFYFRTASSMSENSTVKRHAMAKTGKKNLFMTFLRKELKILLRTSQSVSSLVVVIFVFPVIVYVLNFILAAIRTSTLGRYMTIAFNLMVSLSLLGSYNANSAASLSMEGNEFALLKTAPSNTSVIAWAKMFVIGLVNLLSLIMMAIMLSITTRLSITDILLTVGTIFAVSIGQIAWGFQMDIRNPKIADYATKGDGVTNNKNIAKSIVVSFVMATLTGVLGLFFLLDGYVYGWVRLLVLAVGFMMVRIYLLRRNIQVYFDDIQG